MVSSCPSVIQVSLLERKYRLEMQILTCLGHGWYLKPWNWMWYSREWGPWSSTERKINVLEICKERGGESYSCRRAGLTRSRMKRRDELLMRVWFVHLWQKESRCENADAGWVWWAAFLEIRFTCLRFPGLRVESGIPAESEATMESIDLRLMVKEIIMEFVVENGIDKHIDGQAA